MIVQPTPTEPRVPARRDRSLARFVGPARLAAPVVLLAVVMVVGFLGPRAQPVPPAPPRTPVPGPSTGTDAQPPPRPALQVPALFGDLTALDAADLIEGAGAGTPSTAIALTGVLGLDAADSTCGDDEGSPFGVWCDRHGIIARSTWIGTGTGPFPPLVRVRVPVGVRLPSVIEHASPGDDLDPMPVLVVGRRAVRPAACQGWGDALCEDEFVVDRVAWAGGVRMGLTPLVDDRLGSERRPNPFLTSLDLADLPLLAVLLWPEDVWRLDVDAGTVAVSGTPGEPVWYLRVLDGARGPGMERSVRWMLLAERDLRVLASGRPGAETGTASADRG